MSKFEPSFWLANNHLQTVYATLFRESIPLVTENEIFELSDGDFVECYWLDKPNPEEHKPIVVLFHGLEGSFQSPYIQGMMQTLQAHGYTCVLMHFRGCSGKKNRLPRSYHSGDTSDAKAWLTHLRATFSSSALYAVGYSLGANMLLKLLGEYGNQSPLQAAVAISAPMLLDNSADTINKGFARIYQRRLLNTLKSKLLEKYQQHDMEKLLGKTSAQVEQISTIREFDEIYTSKINGFAGAQDYYDKSSAKQYLGSITTQTLIIHALDDPFMTPAVLPNADEISAAIELEIHQHGGHVGFVTGRSFKPEYFLEQRVMAFLEQLKK